TRVGGPSSYASVGGSAALAPEHPLAAGALPPPRPGDLPLVGVVRDVPARVGVLLLQGLPEPALDLVVDRFVPFRHRCLLVRWSVPPWHAGRRRSTGFPVSRAGAGAGSTPASGRGSR